jgi:hypothetical protein
MAAIIRSGEMPSHPIYNRDEVSAHSMDVEFSLRRRRKAPEDDRVSYNHLRLGTGSR